MAITLRAMMRTIRVCAGAMIRRRPACPGQMADCGIHAMHLASFILGDEVEKLSADFASTVSSRVLEDDAMVNFRTTKGTVGRLWTSTVALGRQHGLDIQIFGEKGGLRWASEQPNQAYWSPLGGRTQIIEKGEAGISDMAAASVRVPIAHPEGFPLAVANIYVDLAAAIRAAKDGTGARPGGRPFPQSRGWACARWQRSTASVESAKQNGAWVDARPPMFR
jgi:predicted dehydrogenase